MLRLRLHSRLLVAILIVTSLTSLPLASSGQKASPVAPKREQVEAIVREAYDKYRIATTSLISGKDANEKWNKILNFYSRAAGEKLTLIEEVYKSEAATNTGNKALSMLLAKYDRIYADPFESVDIYTKQCSVGVTVAQLARMGATLANNGVNPITGEQVIKRENIPYILSAMTMAELYDGSGGWAWRVGLPAKSGVGGGIVAVVPGKGAIAVFAPPLDEAGNSVKAQKVIAYVAKTLDLNLYSPGSVGLK